MPYIVTRRTPRVHQITFEEVLNGMVPADALFEPDYNTPNTETRWIKPERLQEKRKFLSQFDFWGMVKRLENFAEKHKDLYEADRQSLYHTFFIPKSSGGTRRIDAPNPDLMVALNELRFIFEDKFRVLYHTSAFAYIKKRSIVDVLKKHQANESKWFLKTDFSNFFGSTTPEFLYSSLTKVFPFSEIVKYYGGSAALKKALDLCFLNGGLPQGTPISPTLTNIMMIPIDHMLSKMCRERQIQNKYFVYTRYADDILISCKYDFRFQNVVDTINDVCSRFDAPFVIKDKKTRYGSSSGSNWNLGLMLNKDNQITVGHKNKKRYRALLHNFIMDMKNGNPWEPDAVNYLKGITSYYTSVEKEYFEDLIKKNNEKYGVNIRRMMKTMRI